MGTLAAARDTYCLDSLQPGRWATGAQLMGQRCYHRLITPQGTLRGGEDEANFGLDLAGLVGSTDNQQLLAARLPVAVRNELLKDPAVDAVDVVAELVEAAGQASWSLTVSVTGTDGDITLVLSVTDVTVELLGVR